MTHVDGLTPELCVLVLAALLQLIQIAVFAVPANLEVGVRRTLSARDTPIDLAKEMTPKTARLGRALQNHYEALLLFSIAVLAVSLSGANSALTATCAYIYLGARILYIPAYVFGLVPWRSIIWGVGYFATALLLLACLF